MKKIVKYLLFTFITAYIIQINASHDAMLDSYAGMMSFSTWLSLCMLMPTLGTLFAFVDIRKLGWKLNIEANKKWILIAWLSPAVLQLIGAMFYYMVFSDEFDTTGIFLRETNPNLYESMQESGKSYGSYVLKEIFESLTSINAFNAVLFGLGEEIGWRGFLFPELKKRLGRAKGVILGGIIHGAWHFPLMILIGYEYGTHYIGAPVLGLFAFCIFTISTGTISDFLYEKSESIWLSAIFHGMGNSVFNPYMFSKCLHSGHRIFGPGDVGLIAVLPTAIVAFCIVYFENKREKESVISEW